MSEAESTEPTESSIPLHISRYDFTIPQRYTPGPIDLSEGEAKALNQLMLENVRNNVSAWVRLAERNSIDGIISLAVHEALQTRIWAYASAYQFQSRERARPMSAIDAAIAELASSQAETEGNRFGYAPDGPEVQLRYRQLLSSPDIKTKARTIVAERARLAQRTLSDILG